MENTRVFTWVNFLNMFTGENTLIYCIYPEKYFWYIYRRKYPGKYSGTYPITRVFYPCIFCDSGSALCQKVWSAVQR